MADIKEAFELYDENGEGHISVRDAASVVRAFGFNPTEHELQVLFFGVFFNLNISMPSFVSMCFFFLSWFFGIKIHTINTP